MSDPILPVLTGGAKVLYSKSYKDECPPLLIPSNLKDGQTSWAIPITMITRFDNEDGTTSYLENNGKQYTDINGHLNRQLIYTA